MLYVGVDVAKFKHDLCILGERGEILEPNMQIGNNLQGFLDLEQMISEFSNANANKNTKIGLESTGHYSIAITEFFVNKGYQVIEMNPLLTNLFRKAQTLRKTKTDKTDAMTIATMLAYDNSSPTVILSYQMDELKSLARYRRRIVSARSKLKVDLKRFLTIGFPELEQNEKELHSKWIYAILSEFPDAESIAKAHLKRLTTLAKNASNNMISKDRIINVRDLARKSVGKSSHVVRLEVVQTLLQIQMYEQLVNDVDNEIKIIMDTLHSPVMSVPGISYTLASLIIGEIGDINRFESPEKVLAFAGLEPSIHQSGKYLATKNKMVKRGSSNLRWALMEAAKGVARNDLTFQSYLNKKLGEGKHYNVAVSHTAKKLLRVLYYLMKHDKQFIAQ